MEKYAYITLATNEEYLNMAKYLQASLRMVKSKYPLIVMITNNLINNLNLEYFDDFKLIPFYQFNKIQNSKKRYLNTINKFYAYNYTEYEKLMFLDADVFILSNLDHCFEASKGIDFLCSTYSPIRFSDLVFPLNAIILFKPNKKIFSQILILREKDNYYMRDDEMVVRFLFYKKHFDSLKWDNQCNTFENLNITFSNYPPYLLFKTLSQNIELSLKDIEQSNSNFLLTQILDNCVLEKNIDKEISKKKILDIWKKIYSLKYFNLKDYE